MTDSTATRIKGRGAIGNVDGRYAQRVVATVDDGWYQDGEPAPHPATQVTEESARTIISRNDSPDIPFAQSINPYRGCEHGLTFW